MGMYDLPLAVPPEVHFRGIPGSLIQNLPVRRELAGTIVIRQHCRIPDGYDFWIDEFRTLIMNFPLYLLPVGFVLLQAGDGFAQAGIDISDIFSAQFHEALRITVAPAFHGLILERKYGVFHRINSLFYTQST